MRKLFLTAAAGLLLALATAPLQGCKQGEGEICQIDDDCSGNLECNAGTGRCQKPGGQVVDAGTQAPDAAPEPDASTAADAGPDAG